jgi:predicted DNA-binding protein
MYYKEVMSMAHVSLRVTEQEKNWMESYAKVRGINLSEAIKEAFFEKLEDEYDLKTIREFEEEKAKGNIKYYSVEEVKQRLGLD